MNSRKSQYQHTEQKQKKDPQIAMGERFDAASEYFSNYVSNTAQPDLLNTQLKFLTKCSEFYENTQSDKIQLKFHKEYRTLKLAFHRMRQILPGLRDAYERCALLEAKHMAKIFNQATEYFLGKSDYLPPEYQDCLEHYCDNSNNSYKKTISSSHPNIIKANNQLEEAYKNHTIAKNLYNKCNELQRATAAESNDSIAVLKIKAAGREVLNKAKEAKTKMSTPAELQELTTFVEGTKNVVSNPNDQNIKNHAKNTQKAIGMNRQWGKLVGGAMLCVLGATLIATSILLTITTFGVATPLSAFGIALASKMTVAGLAISAAAVGASLTTTAGIFADRGRKGELALAGERVEKEARKEVQETQKTSRR
ncbi:MAG: hypothetical protein KIT56_06805 [Gammaproteobacteria bacterium]|nr:hypothetical protein [Gammaproteobacteria bacterium]MCW5583576.1 hypothetical protein [Gammaproteobacteria bacterium]